MNSKTVIVVLLFLIMSPELNAGEIISNIQKLGFINLTHRSTNNSIANVTGFTKNGREYAIVAVSDGGISIVDVTTPSNPVEVSFVPIPTGADRLYYAEYYSRGYIYATMRPGPLQIINVKDPSNAFEVGQYSQGFSEAYRPWVDERNNRLYLVDTENNPNSYNLLILDISDPENPTEIGGYSSTYHHIYLRNDTLWGFTFGKGVSVLDVSDLSNILLIKRFDPGLPQTHSGWLHDNGKYLTVDHEYAPGEGPDSLGGHLQIFNVENISTANPILLSEYYTATNHTGEASLHHSYWYYNLIYMSYWTEGVRIIDASDPTNPIEVGVYDWEDPNINGIYRDAWGIFPYLPSRNLLVTDRKTGLYILDFLNDGPGIRHLHKDTLSLNQNTFTGEFTQINGNPIIADSCTVYWRRQVTEPWNTTSVQQKNDSTFEFSISLPPGTDKIEYYIEVSDNNGNKTRAPGKAPFLEWYSTYFISDNPLPVNLILFTAKVRNRNVILHWQTASEINNAGFILKRQIVGKDSNFIQIAHYAHNKQLQGAGNSNTTHNYYYIDKDLQSQIIRYVLLSESYSGKIESFGPIEVNIGNNRFSETTELQCFPNPFNDILKIRLNLTQNQLYDSPTSLYILNITGEVVYTIFENKIITDQQNVFTWNAQDTASGVYFLVLSSPQFQKIKKVILLK